MSEQQPNKRDTQGMLRCRLHDTRSSNGNKNVCPIFDEAREPDFACPVNYETWQKCQKILHPLRTDFDEVEEFRNTL